MTIDPQVRKAIVDQLRMAASASAAARAEAVRLGYAEEGPLIEAIDDAARALQDAVVEAVESEPGDITHG